MDKLLQEQFLQAVNSVVLVVDKESKLRPERFPGIQVSLKLSLYQSIVLLAHHFLETTWIILISVYSFEECQRKSDTV